MDLEDLSDNTEQTETPKTRSEYLQGKTELSDVDIINILDLPVEKENRTEIKSYTEQDYSYLKNDEKNLFKLAERLEKETEYLTYHGSYIAKSKLLYEQPVTLCNEIPCLLIGHEINEKFYLLPYGYAKDSSEKYKKFADMLESKSFIDIKRNFGSSIRNNFKKGHQQGKNIFFFINGNDLDYESCKKELCKCVYNRKNNLDKTASYIIYEEKSNRCGYFIFDSDGKLADETEYHLKEIRSFASERPLVVRGGTQNIPSSTSVNINGKNNSVNDVFNSLLIRGEISMLRKHLEIKDSEIRYQNALNLLEAKNKEINDRILQASNNKFIQKEKQLSPKTRSEYSQENKMENTSSENISYENEEMSKAAAIKERNQQKKLTTQMILDQEDKEQMENISATMKSATKDFMDLNATPITEERIDFLKTPTGNKSELSENEWKFSHSSEFKELYGDWEGKIKKDFLLNDDTVSKLTGDEFSRKEGFTLTEQVEQYFNEMNNSVESPFFGKVVLDREGADDSLSHGMGRLKAVAYAGVPNVIKNGVIIDSDLNHKDRGYNSYVIAAPIKIADKNYICEVVLKQNKQENRFYLHEVTEQKKFLERAFVTNPAQKPAHQGTLSNILEKTVSVNYEISCPMGINGEPEKTFVQNEYRKSLDEFQSKNQNTAAKTTDSVSQEENEKSTDILELQDALKVALKETSVPLEKIDFTRENYNKLFPYSKIETPIEIVKMGANQFEKLEKKERQDILLAVHDTLKNPDLIINEHRENISEKNEDNHIYAKSFLINDKVYGIQSVVVSIDGENVSISTHERNINNIVNKIKKPDQLLFAAAKVRLSVERITGEQLVTVNPIRENEYVVSPQPNIQHNSDSVKQEENPSVQMEPRLMKKFDEMKKAIENREKQEGQTAAEKTESAGSKKAESHEKQKVDLIKKAAKDFISAIKNGTAPFLNTTENDFGKILLHPAAIVNASNGLPFSGEAQLLAQIYHQQQKMEGEIVTTFEGAKESGTFIADKPESKKNFVLANKTEQQQKEIIQKTRYFMPEACSEPDKIYAHALQMQRPQKISDYRDLIRHFENIPNGQKEISDLRIRIAHEHLKEIQSRFALKEKRILTVDEINERKKILQDYFKSLPEKHRESEKSAFENTFGLTLNPEEVFKTNLEGNFKNKKFEDVVKSNEKLTDQANRRLSAFIQNNSMEDKKLSEILHEEYNEQLKEEKSTSKKLKIEAKGITEPETYLGKYLAACSSNAEFVTDEDTIKAVQSNLVKKLEENYRLEKYGILKEIGQQAQKISNETTSKIAFDKAHSNKNIKEKNIAKEIGPVGMGN